MSYSDSVIRNAEFLGERARDLAAQEVERGRGLDTKSAGMVAVSVALVAAAASFASGLGDLSGGSGAKTLWAVELGVASVALLVAGGLAVWAIAPRVVRTTVAYNELRRWPTPRVMEQPPTLNRGSILQADLHSVGHARSVNKRKAERLAYATWTFAVALLAIVCLTVSLAAHAAARSDEDGNTEKPARAEPRPRGDAAGSGRADVSDAGTRHRSQGGLG